MPFRITHEDAADSTEENPMINVYLWVGDDLAGSGLFMPEESYFYGIDVDTKYRRLGVASAIYDYVEKKLYYRVVPSGSLKPDGISFWKNRLPGKPDEYWDRQSE